MKKVCPWGWNSSLMWTQAGSVPTTCGEEDQQYPYFNQRGLISAAVMSTPEIWGDTANKDAPNNLLH